MVHGHGDVQTVIGLDAERVRHTLRHPKESILFDDCRLGHARRARCVDVAQDVCKHMLMNIIQLFFTFFLSVGSSLLEIFLFLKSNFKYL
jgi:hypothetical protein